MDVYATLKERNITLPEPLPKGGLYLPVNQVGNMLYVSGQGSIEGDKTLTGKAGSDVTLEEAQHAAYVCGLNTLAALEAYTGDLNKIEKCVKILGFVASDPSFTSQPQAMNGCSSLFAEVFGDNGMHARSAIGTNVLPSNLTVEVESIWKLKD